LVIPSRLPLVSGGDDEELRSLRGADRRSFLPTSSSGQRGVFISIMRLSSFYCSHSLLQLIVLLICFIYWNCASSRVLSHISQSNLALSLSMCLSISILLTYLKHLLCCIILSPVYYCTGAHKYNLYEVKQIETTPSPLTRCQEDETQMFYSCHNYWHQSDRPGWYLVTQ
jgi:hypothetical protein